MEKRLSYGGAQRELRSRPGMETLRYSERRFFQPAVPLLAWEIEERVGEALQALACEIAVEGVVLGHIKAALCADGASCTLSVTRLGVTDREPSENWDADRMYGSFEVILNVLSLAHTDFDVQAFFKKRFGI